MGGSLDRWERDAEHAATCVRSFIAILIANQAKIMLCGCPVGSLCIELAKLGHPARPEATRIFGLFRDWLRRQFERLGAPDADALALHVLARSQGVATLATAFKDPDFVSREVALAGDWLRAEIAKAAPTAASA